MSTHELFELGQESALGVVDAWTTSDEPESPSIQVSAAAPAHSATRHAAHGAIDEIARAFGIDAVV